MPDLQTVLRQRGVNLQPAGSDRHVRVGWMGIACPWCAGSAGLHLGYNMEKSFFNCWRCGFHPTLEVIERLCHVDRETARDILRSADGPGGRSTRARDAAVQRRIGLHRYKRPSDVEPLARSHRRYLERRGFDPDRIAEEWGVMGTGPTSYLDRIDYRFRLFVPISWDGTEVSFQARDVTGKSDKKYVACPMDRELTHHKHVVYRHPEAAGGFGIAVEGVIDAWRLGRLAFATFGIRFTTEQVNAIAGLYRRVAILYDREGEAPARARELLVRLGGVGVEATVFELEGDDDPGGMSEGDAAEAVSLMSEWGFAI